MRSNAMLFSKAGPVPQLLTGTATRTIFPACAPTYQRNHMAWTTDVTNNAEWEVQIRAQVDGGGFSLLVVGLTTAAGSYDHDTGTTSDGTSVRIEAWDYIIDVVPLGGGVANNSKFPATISTLIGNPC